MVHNAARILESSLSKHSITPSGIKYLKMVLDPFHDAQLEIVGAPDSATGSSLVHDFRRDQVITSPDPTSQEDWDCHIAFIPLVRSAFHHTVRGEDFGQACNLYGYPTCEDAEDSISFNHSAFQSQLPPGCFVACCVPAGTNTFDPTIPSAIAKYYTIDFGDTLLANDVSSRMIGAAFEVHNTSADVYKQGSSISYKQEAEVSATQSYRSKNLEDGVNAIQNPSQIYVATAPPLSYEAAKPLQGITMEASAGCLIPLTFDVHENPARLPSTSNWMLQTSDITSDDDFQYRKVWANNSLFYQDSIYASDASGTFKPVYRELGDLSQIPKIKTLPFNQAGCYFSGLHHTNSLTLSVRCFIETFPKADNPDLSLVRPSPHFDGPALDALSYAFSDLNSGYPVSMNAAGDYFRLIGQSINKKFGDEIRAVKKCATDVAKHTVEKSLVGMTTALSTKNKKKTR